MQIYLNLKTIILIVITFFVIIYFVNDSTPPVNQPNVQITRKFKSFINSKQIKKFHLNQQFQKPNDQLVNYTKCTIDKPFKISTVEFNVTAQASSIYKRILNSTRNSKYFTTNANDACLSVLSIDTLDRDRWGKNYVKNLSAQIDGYRAWSNGSNIVVFNLYAGTWPEYATNDLDFNYTNAVLAQASIKQAYYRYNHDIAFPLFHSNLDSNRLYDGLSGKKYFLTFKGKRYLLGEGSQLRNSLYHIDNGRDIILLTTCNHTANLNNLKDDDKCELDDSIYDRFNYDDLLENSTFCLIPRGRRLATYRFLEAIRVGCIPVILSNGWILPFSEVLDWSRAVIWADERLITHIPLFLRNISDDKLKEMRKNGVFFYKTYFSSIKRIVYTTFEILHERVYTHEMTPKFIWNTAPGIFHFNSFFSKNPCDYPYSEWHSSFESLSNSNCLESIKYKRCALVIVCTTVDETVNDAIVTELIEEVYVLNCKPNEKFKFKNEIKYLSLSQARRRMIHLWRHLFRLHLKNSLNCIVLKSNVDQSDANIDSLYNSWKINVDKLVWLNRIKAMSSWSGSCNSLKLNDYSIIDPAILHRLTFNQKMPQQDNTRRRQTRSGQSSSASSSSSNNDSNTSNTNENNKGLNTTLLYVAGFVAILFYTIWSSLRTYSNQEYYDME